MDDSGRGWGYITLDSGQRASLVSQSLSRELKKQGIRMPGEMLQEARMSSAKACGRELEEEQRRARAA